MPINRKNKGPPRVTESLIIKPLLRRAAWPSSPARRLALDEQSLNSRATIEAAIAQKRAELRAGPPGELRWELEDELERLFDWSREYEKKIVERTRSREEEKKAARVKRMGGPLRGTPLRPLRSLFSQESE
jgi:hypothetical protein